VETIYTVPNFLTLLRIGLAPIFLALYVSGDTSRALWTFAVAAATDLLDGLAARLLDQKSRLGAFLDPVADKVLEACGLLALAGRGQIPWWLPILVLSRDGAQFLGAAWLRGARRRIPIAPTRIGKYATFCLAATVLTALAGEFAGSPGRVAPFVAALGLLATECVMVSWLQYGLYFVRSARGESVGS
jgi:cardiolipin synthase (CMP-forming)